MESEGIELIPGEVLNAETPDARSTYFEVSARVPGAPGTLYYAQTDDGRVAILKGPPSVGGRAPSLEREMRHLALLAPHPNVLRVLGKHKDPRGHTLLFLERLFESPFLVLNREHVRARLQERAEPKAPPKTGAVARARRLAPPVSVALELAYELALALEHLHSKGIVHGDVRPENLMLAIDWREPEIPDSQYFERIARGRWRGVLVDLGGSRTGKELEGLARGLPLVQPPKTTPLYVPPEILPGQKDATGQEKPRYGFGMDLYAFGLTVYEILTGHAPYAHLRFPPDEGDSMGISQAKRHERNGEQRPIFRANLDAIDWSDCAIETRGREAAQEKAAFQDELWELLSRATSVEPGARLKMPELRALLGKLLRVETITPEQHASERDAASDDPRTWRNWSQKRLRLDSFSSRLAFAGRDGTSTQKDPKTLRIQRGGSDFWEQQGFAPK